jgi:hypothetical protein
MDQATTLGEPHFILEPIRAYGVQLALKSWGHEFGPIRIVIFRQLHGFATANRGA